MTEKLDIVVVGELNMDLILTGLPSFLEMGKNKLSKDMDFTLGSASAIFASNIAKLGKKVGFLGKIGDDILGDYILQNLLSRNVDTSKIIRDKNEKTGICVSISFPKNYAMASFPGVRESFCLEDIDFDYISKARHMHLSSYYLQTGMKEGCAELFKHAKELGLTTSFDSDNDPSGKWDSSILDTLQYVDVFLPNENEALHISRCDDLQSALNVLSEIVNTVVIKTGKNGAWVKNREQTIHANAFKIDVVDTTGAGDSFNSGFIYQYLNGADIDKCVLWGNACAAISTTKIGGTTSFPEVTELEHFFSEKSEELKEIIDIRI